MTAILPFRPVGGANVLRATKATAPDVMPCWVRTVRITLAALGLLAVGCCVGLSIGLSAGLDAVRAACPVTMGDR